jgi:PAS domain S-box-containing protein
LTARDPDPPRPTEQHSRDPEAVLRAVIESTSAPVFSVDTEGRYTSYNRSHAQIMRALYNAEIEVGAHLTSYVPVEADRAATWANIQRALDGEQFAVETESGDGALSHRWFEVEYNPLRDESGRVTGVAVFANDVTERRLAVEALAESEAMLSSFYDSSPLRMGVVEILDGDLLFVSGNRALARTFRRPEGRIRNLRASQLGHLGRSIDSLAMPFHEAAASGRPVHLDYPSSAGEGEWRHATVSPIAVPPGARTRLAFVIEDITERKRAEEALLEFDRQLQRSQKLESLGVLAGGIAHDFNNILMAVLGHADLALAELPHSAPARGDILEIVQASRRAAELCRQMLAYSGRGHFVIEPIEFSTLVEDMVSLLQSTISKKALLNLHLEKHLPSMQGDASQLSQVVMNLVINASEAIAERSGVITISTGAAECTREYLRETYAEQHLPSGLYLTLEVSDTGVGMDAETQERIFEPFFTTKFTGRGLGLSAVLGIVRGHKGALTLHSEPGRGTSFKLLFPASESGADQALRQSGAASGDWRGEGTVILVDDEETIRALGRRMIENLGFKALVAADGREALDVYRAHMGEIVLVLLDLTMPHMDGEQAFRELRLLDPGVRVVMSSGYTESDIAPRFTGEGLVGFLQKPYTQAELRETIRAALDVPRRADGDSAGACDQKRE